MCSREQQPNNPKESLKDLVAKETASKWNEYLLKQGFPSDFLSHPERVPTVTVGECGITPLYSWDQNFPEKVVAPILDVVSSREEAEVVIDEILNRIKTEDKGILSGYHSHDGIIGYMLCCDIDQAVILAQNTEKLYQLLCERRNPDLKTTEKVIVRLFGTMVSRAAMEALKAIPGETSVLEEGSRYDDDATCYYGWQIPFQKKAIQLIRNQGIERFEWLCSQTANILANGVYRAKVLCRSTDHHWNWEEGEGYFYHFGSIEAAIKYLKDNGIESTEIGPNR